jgi:SAM-dependent methyltransferase
MTAETEYPRPAGPPPLLNVRPLYPQLPPTPDWYEERKRNLILSVLPRRYYQLAVEPGCGEGRVTAALAARCSRVMAWDRDASVVEACRSNTAHLRNVEVRVGVMPHDWPKDTADLILLSEIGYHLEPGLLDALIDRASLGLSPGGTLVAAHRRQTADEFALGGDDVHAHLFGRAGLARVGGYADDELRIDVFVAEATQF